MQLSAYCGAIGSKLLGIDTQAADVLVGTIPSDDKSAAAIHRHGGNGLRVGSRTIDLEFNSLSNTRRVVTLGKDAGVVAIGTVIIFPRYNEIAAAIHTSSAILLTTTKGSVCPRLDALGHAGCVVTLKVSV